MVGNLDEIKGKYGFVTYHVEAVCEADAMRHPSLYQGFLQTWNTPTIVDIFPVTWKSATTPEKSNCNILCYLIMLYKFYKAHEYAAE